MPCVLLLLPCTSQGHPGWGAAEPSGDAPRQKEPVPSCGLTHGWTAPTPWPGTTSAKPPELSCETGLPSTVTANRSGEGLLRSRCCWRPHFGQRLSDAVVIQRTERNFQGSFRSSLLCGSSFPRVSSFSQMHRHRSCEPQSHRIAAPLPKAQPSRGSSMGKSISSPCATAPPCPAGIQHSCPRVLCGSGCPAETTALMGRGTGG